MAPKFVWIIHDQPESDSAINQAVDEFNVPPNVRAQLIAQRPD
jgi:hypothetical protein